MNAEPAGFVCFLIKISSLPGVHIRFGEHKPSEK